ncbi:MAG: hypothetical protein ACRDOB_15205 [Streptosporangiaceae bacterium]
MPAVTPIPRGPTVLTLYTAADLLTGPGCPVCRYAGEASDRYLSWFALEGHADAATITGLCSSLGMCCRHTRGLISQPGAAIRLTAVYRYILQAARDRLSGRAARLGSCPACRHDDGAAGRALETLVEGLADDAVRERYRELGGLCLPHLGSASTRSSRRVGAWLSRTMAATVNARLATAHGVAGTDRDAEARAVLRRAASAGPGACTACLAAGQSEQENLARILHADDHGLPDRHSLLCAGHLSDLTVLAGRPAAVPILAWQADCLAASLNRGGGASRLCSLGRPREHPGSCPVCRTTERAGRQALEDARALAHSSRSVPGRHMPLCVRHVLGLRALDPRAGRMTDPGMVERADTLIAELSEAFGKSTWARRHESRGQEMTAWRRAAVFVDGGVFCGGTPRDITR